MQNSRTMVARSGTRVPKMTVLIATLVPHATWAGVNGVLHQVSAFLPTHGHARFRQTVYQTKNANERNRNS
jgi:hypothetical protein